MEGHVMRRSLSAARTRTTFLELIALAALSGCQGSSDQDSTTSPKDPVLAAALAAIHDGEPQTEDEKRVYALVQRTRARGSIRFEVIRWGPHDLGEDSLSDEAPAPRILRFSYRVRYPDKPWLVVDRLFKVSVHHEGLDKDGKLISDAGVEEYQANVQGDDWLRKRLALKRKREARAMDR
jgi:hypothetical protein